MNTIICTLTGVTMPFSRQSNWFASLAFEEGCASGIRDAFRRWNGSISFISIVSWNSKVVMSLYGVTPWIGSSPCASSFAFSSTACSKFSVKTDNLKNEVMFQM